VSDSLSYASPVTSAESGRARPLPPDERRAKLVAATLPLLAQYGTKVTTRQIAQAAGVAEGTIFRVFPHKDGLVRVAISQALDPAPTMAELLGVDIDLPLRERLVVVTGILQRRLIQVFDLMVAIRLHGPPPEDPDQGDDHAPKTRHEPILREVVRLLEPDRERFRCPVPEVARVLRLLTFAGSHPLITDGDLMAAEEIAAVVLDGTLHHPHTDKRGKETC
jgi:AcrR family transcriptional regulator